MITCAVIPCYNEAATIGEIVTKSLHHVDKVVVADNMSQDATIAEAERSGAIVCCCSVRGAGAATRRGIRRSLVLGADAIVLLDGDGQHDPDEIPQLLSPILSRDADIACGVRTVNGNATPAYRRIGLSVISAAYNVGSRKPWQHDVLSGFRAINRDAASNLLITDTWYGFSAEMLMKARLAGYRIVDVPVTCIYHKNVKDNSTINPVVHGVRVLLSVIMWRVRCGY